mgnify:CR=1 FL=1
MLGEEKLANKINFWLTWCLVENGKIGKWAYMILFSVDKWNV